MSPTIASTMGDAPAPAAPAVDQAIDWMVRLRSGEASPQDWDDWQAWRAAAPEHGQAWERLQQIQGRMAGLPTATTTGTFERAWRDVNRRRALRLLGLGGTVAATGWLATPWWHDVALMADLRTTTGERRQVQLPDGSSLWLDTDTAVDLRFTAQERRLDLRRGRVLVTSGADVGVAYRPLSVHTAQGRALALGTRFLVSREGDATRVQVFEHAIEAQAASAGGPVQRLRAGQQALLSAEGIGPVAALDTDADAWTDGVLVARDMRLADFAAALARYRPGRLACDPAVAELRVSGVFNLQDTDAALALLVRTRPVQARALTRYWVTLLPR